ncbi:hypothetical protein WJR50_33810 [Catalinimonas sp. 4WD22]|uniref:hypothetical protein n=1 Tax=Catalinimonas locisalis TaxID=3133978 RepID=UPI00310147B4
MASPAPTIAVIGDGIEMTVDQFKQELKEPEKTNDILNYLVCVFFIGFGIWMIGDLIINDFYHPRHKGNYLILLAPLLSIIIGIYGFWRIPKDYQIGCINSVKTIDEKWMVINEYLSQLKIRSKKIENNQIECVYRNKFFNSLVISVYLDENKVLFNVQSLDSVNKGIIDFGLSKRATKRLKKFLENRL